MLTAFSKPTVKKVRAWRKSTVEASKESYKKKMKALGQENRDLKTDCGALAAEVEQ